MSVLTILTAYVFQQKVRYTEMNSLNDNFSIVDNGYGCKVYNSTAQTISTTTATEITFDSESWDDDGMHEGVTNPSRITIPADGRYNLMCKGRWETDLTGYRIMRLLKNGSDVLITQRDLNISGVAEHYQTLTWQEYLEEDDYIELQVEHSETGDLDFDQQFLIVSKFV